MRPLIAIVLCALLLGGAGKYAGNPYYDFSDSIIRVNTLDPKIPENGYLSQLLSISGYDKESNKYDPVSDRQVDVDFSKMKVVVAKEFILQDAKKYRIILINEAHNKPQNRLFTKSLLDGLHAEGYNVFMAEGIWQHNNIDKRGYPVDSEGVLLNEPAYASTLRYAKHKGYKIAAYDYNKNAEKKAHYWDDSIKLDKYGSMKYISYEPRDSSITYRDANGPSGYMMTSVREQAQAANILNVIKNNPHSKFIIHVGYSHLDEGGPMMGSKLKQLLDGEDLLTINQADMRDTRPVVDINTHKKITRSFFYLMQDTVKNEYFRPEEGSVGDYVIFNSQVSDSLQRPGYLFHDAEKRIVYQLPQKQLDNYPCLFEAYDATEYATAKQHAIAIDVVMVKDRKTPPPLLLYKGNYTVLKKKTDGTFEHFAVKMK